MLSGTLRGSGAYAGMVVSMSVVRMMLYTDRFAQQALAARRWRQSADNSRRRRPTVGENG
ncbi:MAG: hypothetical protein ACKO9Q_30900 [Pirellula sp.]